MMQVFESKAYIDHFAKSVDEDEIVKAEYNLSVSSDVETKDTRVVVDITQLNAELKTSVARVDQLCKDIDAIVTEVEGA